MENDNFNQDSCAVEHFKTKLAEFNKQHAQAKDYVKFLTTLERQFKNISKGELNVIDDTLQSLMNGLKLIWTISRHIKQNEEKMQQLFECIINEICEKVSDKIVLKNIFKQPSQSMELIK